MQDSSPSVLSMKTGSRKWEDLGELVMNYILKKERKTSVASLKLSSHCIPEDFLGRIIKIKYINSICIFLACAVISILYFTPPIYAASFECGEVFDVNTDEFLFTFSQLLRKKAHLPVYPEKDPYESMQIYDEKVAKINSVRSRFYANKYATYLCPEVQYDVVSQIAEFSFESKHDLYVRSLGHHTRILSLKMPLGKSESRQLLNLKKYLDLKIIFSLSSSSDSVVIHEISLYCFGDKIFEWFN